MTTTPQDMVKQFGDAITAGAEAVEAAQVAREENIALKAMIVAKSTIIEGMDKAHAAALEEVRDAHAARVAELEQDLREARLTAKEAQSNLDVMVGRWQQLGLASAEAVGRATPRVSQKAHNAVADALEGARAPDTPEMGSEQPSNVEPLKKAG